MKAESHSAEAESAPVAARADRVEADFTPVVVRATVVFAESVARAATRTETAALFPSTLPEAPSPEAATRAAPADRAGASAKSTAAPADRARCETDGVAAEAAFAEAEGEAAAVEEERGRPESHVVSRNKTDVEGRQVGDRMEFTPAKTFCTFNATWATEVVFRSDAIQASRGRAARTP